MEPCEAGAETPSTTPETAPKKKYKSKDDLPSTYTLAAVRLAFPDISINAIAKMVGCSVGTVASRMSSAAYELAIQKIQGDDSYNALRLEARSNIRPALRELNRIVTGEHTRDVDKIAASRACLYALERLDALTHLETDRLTLRAEVEAIREGRASAQPDTDGGDHGEDATSPEVPPPEASPPPPLPDASPAVGAIDAAVTKRLAAILAPHQAKG